jgi:hypothetical protein
MKKHLGFEKSANKEGGRKNYQNGSYAKTVKSKDGEIELEVPPPTDQFIVVCWSNIYTLTFKITNMLVFHILYSLLIIILIQYLKMQSNVLI